MFFPNLSSRNFLAGFYRVFRVNPNPNPNFRVLEMSGIDFLEKISGNISENLKYPTRIFLVTRKPTTKPAHGLSVLF